MVIVRVCERSERLDTKDTRNPQNYVITYLSAEMSNSFATPEPIEIDRQTDKTGTPEPHQSTRFHAFRAVLSNFFHALHIILN